MKNPRMDSCAPCEQWVGALAQARPGEALNDELAAHVAACANCAATLRCMQTQDAAFRWLAFGADRERPKLPSQETLDALAQEDLQWPLVVRLSPGVPQRIQQLWHETEQAAAYPAHHTAIEQLVSEDADARPVVEQVSADEACDRSDDDEMADEAPAVHNDRVNVEAPQAHSLTRGRSGSASVSVYWVSASFLTPNDPRWAGEDHYSATVTYELLRAYASFNAAHGANEDRLKLTRRRLKQCASMPMSSHQRLCVYYALGRLYFADEDYTQASAWMGNALELSTALDDPGDCALLAYFHGTIVRHAQRFSVAAQDYDLSLRYLRKCEGDQTRLHTVLELEMLMRLASSFFILERYDLSRQLLEQARRLTGRASEEQRENPRALAAVQLDAAGLEWLAALHYRWSGEPERALRHAMAASDVYSGLQRRQLLGRIAIIIADITLDLAGDSADETMTQPLTHSQEVYTALARPYVEQAMSTLRAEHDTPGEYLAQLTYARYNRVARQTAPRIATLEQVARLARNRNDLLLLAQAQTTLGDEFQACGERESALSCYRLALDTLRATDAPAMGVWARRKLLRAAEFMTT